MLGRQAVEAGAAAGAATNERTVLVTARQFDPAAAAWLEAQGCRVRQPDLGGKEPRPELLPGLLEGVDGWIVGGTNVGHALLAAFPRLQVIARRGVGYEQIDVPAARALGRVVTIAAGGNGPSVADHAVGMMLAVAKQLVQMTEQIRQGDWTYRAGVELHGKTVGIIGLGRVGKLVAQRLAGFDVTVLATDIVEDASFAAARGIRFVDLPTLLRESDFVSVHAPLTDATRDLIGAEALAAMKPGAILVNTARGGIVNEAALLAALQSGHLAGAGLDVFCAEKDAAHNEVALALARLPNVVSSPHTAAATVEGLARANRIAAGTVVAVLSGGSPPQDCVIADGRNRSAG
jgi:D-3-phosphoglycerate dehydrogenase